MPINIFLNHFLHGFQRKYSFLNINIRNQEKMGIPVSTMKKVKGIYVTFAWHVQQYKELLQSCVTSFIQSGRIPTISIRYWSLWIVILINSFPCSLHMVRARARVRKVNVPTVITLPSSLDKYSIFDLSEC